MRAKYHPLPQRARDLIQLKKNPSQPPFKKGRSKLFRIQHQISAHAHSIETGIDIHDFTGNAVCPR